MLKTALHLLAATAVLCVSSSASADTTDPLPEGLAGLAAVHVALTGCGYPELYDDLERMGLMVEQTLHKNGIQTLPREGVYPGAPPELLIDFSCARVGIHKKRPIQNHPGITNPSRCEASEPLG